MDRFHNLEVFCTVAELRSFSKAANSLRISAAAVTRAVASLEEHLGARLLNRTTRSLSLTEAGSQFLDSARRILADLEEAEKTAAGDAAAPSRSPHPDRARSPSAACTCTPALLEFLRAQPKVTASLTLLDRIVSLTEEGIDAAIRIGAICSDSSLVAARRRRGAARLSSPAPPTSPPAARPTAPADLRQHRDPGLSRRQSGAGVALSRDGKRTDGGGSIAPLAGGERRGRCHRRRRAGRGHHPWPSPMWRRPLLAEGRPKLVLDEYAPCRRCPSRSSIRRAA